MKEIQKVIEKAWDKRDEINTSTSGEIRGAVQEVLEALDSGQLRVAEKIDEGWQVNEWAKKAVLLSFRLNSMSLMGNSPSLDGRESSWYDKVPPKTLGWDEKRFAEANFRAVPGCFIRHSAYIAPNVVLMPSFVNIGAYVDEGTMIDTWATVGSCAQIGKHCHISGGAGIGGVLEPLQAGPVIIEDNCFIGARSEIAEGVIVETGAVISMGVYIGASTKIVNRETGEISYGRVPAYSVVVPGSLPSKIDSGKSANIRPPGTFVSPEDVSLYCAVIVKQVDEKTRSKTSINELLRS